MFLLIFLILFCLFLFLHGFGRLLLVGLFGVLAFGHDPISLTTIGAEAIPPSSIAGMNEPVISANARITIARNGPRKGGQCTYDVRYLARVQSNLIEQVYQNQDRIKCARPHSATST